VAKQFARVTFLSDTRSDLARVKIPALVLQCDQDVIAPIAVGQYVNRHLPGSRMTLLRATGHCPHLSAPAETVAAMNAFLADLRGANGHGG
jgi:sigma-B regulation protein RsbQ